MTHVYPLSRTSRALIIYPLAGLAFLFGYILYKDAGLGVAQKLAWAAFVAGLLLLWVRCALESKVITSPAGLEYHELLIMANISWEQVSSVVKNPFGIVQLHTKTPIYAQPWLDRCMRFWGYDRHINISPYIEDLANSQLLLDIQTYTNNKQVAEFTRSHQRSGAASFQARPLVLYLLAWLMVLILMIIALSEVRQQLSTQAHTFTSLLFSQAGFGLMITLCAAAAHLADFNQPASKLAPHEIRRRTVGLYLAPVVFLALSISLTLAAWLALPQSILTSNQAKSLAGLACLLLGGYSPGFTQWLLKPFFPHCRA